MSFDLDRRQFLETTFMAGIGSLFTPSWGIGSEPSKLKIASFRFDVSPPMGHPLCGGWIKPVVGYDDSLEAIGFVLTGAGDPIVICAVDWTGLLNAAHIKWRQALAEAAGTTPERVAVQCVHQHNAPFVCLEAKEIISEIPSAVVFVDFYEECLKRGRQAIAEAMTRLRPVTHIATSQAKVEKVAGNRRFIGPDGKVVDWRGSSSKVPRHKELPEGLIDPWMKTVAFYENDQQLVSCHYYATHPMSYYGDGRVCSDFVGLARKRRQTETPQSTQIYFTGCSGNVAAGKYNDATPEARKELTDRIYNAIVESESQLKPEPVKAVGWKSVDIMLPPSASLTEDSLLSIIKDPSQSDANRIRSAMRLAWIRRCQRGEPIVLSSLHLNQATLLHLPAESFVEYQLRAQQAQPDRFVATAAYGDGGPWYIPVAEAYPQGGYEVSVAFSDSGSDAVLTTNCQSVLKSPSST